jgi:RNA polymerase sigma-70 factor, ECF subfamily
MTMIGPEFPAVLEAATRGDEEAFGRLWRDLQPRLLRYFMVAVPAAAEDLASETWLAVARSLGRFRGNEPAFRAWVFTIARHELLDWRRRAARRPIEDVPVTGLTDRAAMAAPDDPAASAMEGLSTRAALAMVATLPADQAEAVVLRVVAGLDVDRVAAIMDKRPGTVRVLTHRGLRRLAERLGADARIRRVV